MKPYAPACAPLLICLVACASEPPLRTYLLTPPLGSAALTPKTALPTARIVVPRVLIPDYLDTTDILLRDGSNEVTVSATGQWGERLSHGLTRALAADLAARLPFDEVLLETSSSAQRQVLINVNALDLWPDGRCAIAASWTIVDQAASHAVASGSGTFTSSLSGRLMGGDDARLVDAIARAVGKLADAIAPTVR
jgi:uncharacterized lipoprotein YmbA